MKIEYENYDEQVGANSDHSVRVHGFVREGLIADDPNAPWIST